MQDIVTQIETALRTRGWSQAELARRLGHQSHSVVNRLLNRNHAPGGDLLQAIANAMDVELVVPPVPEIRIRPSSRSVS